jgi:hypothetical protein
MTEDELTKFNTELDQVISPDWRRVSVSIVGLLLDENFSGLSFPMTWILA